MGTNVVKRLIAAVYVAYENHSLYHSPIRPGTILAGRQSSSKDRRGFLGRFVAICSARPFLA